MYPAKKTHACLKIGLVLLLAGILLPAALGSARQDTTTMPHYYPSAFSGLGCIDRLGPQEVVIDDRLYKLCPEVSFNTPKMKNASRCWFHSGSLVGFVANSNNEIVSLWYIRKCR